MDDYYDAHPRRVPKIPIAIVGFFGSDHDVIGRMVGSFTGLPVVEVNPLIEHVAGRSRGRIAAEDGLEALRTREADALDRALRSTPPGVVVLGETTLDDEACRIRIERETALVFVSADFDAIARRVHRRNDTEPGCYAPWIPAGPVDGDDLAAMLALRTPAYEAAVIRVDSGERAHARVARDIVDAFGLWGERPD